jgi:hypothetical protein
MKMNRVQHVIATTVPALLSLTFALAALGGTSDTAADFPAVVAFEVGKAEFLPGDSITIQQVRGTSSTIGTGETYCVEGTYTLASREEADLALFATTVSDIPTPIDPRQHTRIEKGTSAFRLVKTMRQEGYLHLSFYSVPSGGDFGGVYFGQGKWVLHHKGWSEPLQKTQAKDHTATVASTGQPVSLTGPNQFLLEYLGDPVAPPADMDAAYTKDGLIKAVQTAARNAGITLKRIEIDDSEYPFLVGVICKEGDYSKLKEQLRKMEGYAYNGSVGSNTHNAMNIVPYRVMPPALFERVSHRTGLRMEVLHDKISRLE